jgi:hypothetical protein
VCYPALPCKLAAVVIHRMLWCRKVCYPCAAMQARCCHDPQNAPGAGVIPAAMQARCHDPQNALVRKVCIPCACKLAVVMIHRMLLVKGCAILCRVMHASCCHDPQNALVEERCYPCAAMQARCLIHRMLWCKKGAILRCHACKLS